MLTALTQLQLTAADRRSLALDDVKSLANAACNAGGELQGYTHYAYQKYCGVAVMGNSLSINDNTKHYYDGNHEQGVKECVDICKANEDCVGFVDNGASRGYCVFKKSSLTSYARSGKDYFSLVESHYGSGVAGHECANVGGNGQNRLYVQYELTFLGTNVRNGVGETHTEIDGDARDFAIAQCQKSCDLYDWCFGVTTDFPSNWYAACQLHTDYESFEPFWPSVANNSGSASSGGMSSALNYAWGSVHVDIDLFFIDTKTPVNSGWTANGCDECTYVGGSGSPSGCYNPMDYRCADIFSSDWGHGYNTQKHPIPSIFCQSNDSGTSNACANVGDWNGGKTISSTSSKTCYMKI